MAVLPVRFRIQWSSYLPGEVASFSPELARKLTSPINRFGMPPQPPIADYYTPGETTFERAIVNRIVDEGDAVTKIDDIIPIPREARRPRGRPRKK